MALRRLSAELSRGLNRDVSANLSQVAVRFYKQNATKEAFCDATKALGFPAELSRTLYVFINDNIEELDKEVQADGAAARTPVFSEKNKPFSATPAHKSDSKDKRKQLAMEYDDLEEGLPQVAPQRSEKKITFKKIKKADARRLKEVSGLDAKEEVTAVPGMHRSTETDRAPETDKGPEMDRNPEMDREPEMAVESVGARMQEETDPTALVEALEAAASESGDEENDREWYNLDEHTSADLEQYQDLESDYRPRKHAMNGGGFDRHGNYIDHDHEAGDSRASIPIVPHFIVPTFLQGSEHHLTLQFDSGARRIASTVDPIKDPDSELAKSARNGSFVVRDRKEKKERAEQAKERVLQAEPEAGESNNEPQTETSYTFDEIQAQRRSLPAYKARGEILQMINDNQIVVIVGETGSGKTTQIAQFLLEEGMTKSQQDDGTRLMVACTQPRRVAAMSVAKRVSEEVGCKLGDDVGYTIRFEDKTSPRRTRLKFMTEGILLREMLMDPDLDSYSCVIMDEAHERSLNTDVLLGLFRELLRRRRNLKLIVTSATMNAERFVKFFGNAPQYFIPGRTFPVDVFYAKTATPDYVETAVKQVVTIHLANRKGDGDILVFMTGQEDIEATCELIHEKLALLDDPPPLDVYPIYSTLPADLQKKIFTKQSHERRKVIVATNIAETSLTVDGIRYVVDTGLMKMKLFNPKLGMDALQVVPVSQANAQQRSGRAGRTAPGLAYRLYTESAASNDQIHAQPIPEIQRTNLASVMLLLKSLNVNNILAFPFLDSPPPDLLSCSLYELWAMGALSKDGLLTDLGRRMSTFPMEPTLAKVMILSCQKRFSCSLEVVTIVSMLSVPSVFNRPKERASEADSMREKFSVHDSDHLTLLNVYTQWEQRAGAKNMTSAKLAAWSRRNFLHQKSLLRAREVRNQLMLIMKKAQYPLVKASSETDIRKCLCAAYYHQSASLVKMNGGGGGRAEYANMRQPAMTMYVHPTSSLVGSTSLSPQYVVYDELVLTKKEYMQCVTAVKPEWLLEFGYIFYGVSARTKKELEQEQGLKIVDADELRMQMKPKKKQLPKAPEPPVSRVARFKPRGF